MELAEDSELRFARLSGARIWHEPLYTDPFFLAGLFLGLAGMQTLLIGLLGELLMRTYYESQGKTTYVIREALNFPERPGEPPARRPSRPLRAVPRG